MFAATSWLVLLEAYRKVHQVEFEHVEHVEEAPDSAPLCVLRFIRCNSSLCFRPLLVVFAASCVTAVSECSCGQSM